MKTEMKVLLYIKRNGQDKDAYIHKAFPAFFFQQPPQTAPSLHQNKSPKASRTT